MHLTAVAVRSTGYLTVYPGASVLPATSTLNMTAGVISSNNALVAPGGDGAIDIRVAGAADVIVDLLGWTVAGAAPPAGGVVPLSPTRLLDTRGHAPLRNGGMTVSVPQVPADAAAAVLNVTTVDSSQVVQVVAWAAGSTRPDAPAVHGVPRRAVAASVIVGLSAGAVVSLAVRGEGTTDLVVDLAGYIVGGQAGPGGLVAITPTRALDTRTSHHPLADGGKTTILLGGHLLPAETQAAVVTITSVPSSTAGGYIVSYPDGDSAPPVSMLNPLRDAPVASQQVVPVGPDGAITVQYFAGPGDLVVDVDGYVRARHLPAVQPSELNQADLSPLADGGQESLARSVLVTTNRYALQTWWPGVAQTLMATAPRQLGQSDAADTVRRLAMQAFSLAVSLATNAYDADAIGVSPQTAHDVVAQIVDRMACAHRANYVGGWGSSWQSSMWSSYVGRAAWLLWTTLSATTQTCVQRMVISEADFIATLSPKYMVSKTGVTLTPGDTGAEEDSWYALAPALAIAMMPTAEQRDLWRRQEEQMLIAAWARPGDTTSTTTVDGLALSAWLQGSNVLPTGAVVNHNRIAPDYSTTVYQSIDTLEMAALAGQYVPQATLTGVGPVYDALSTVSYAAPPYAAPGGVIIAPNAAPIYYPQGCDWGTGQEAPYALFDADADVFGFANPADPVPPHSAAATHLAAAAAMQQRTPSGAMYLNPTEYTYVGREEHTAQLAAQIYLAYFTKERLTVTVTPQPATLTSRDAVPTLHAPPTARNESILKH